ncbi:MULTISPECIES: nucleotidyltransferase family protein [unclassified Ruminococcus]|uniref:nucleotidyltransferase domain-containing protein n=1 Tax=unclassified Ruminococcus TaxID=2608920 RepID=UPI00210CEA5F|nr:MULTISPECIES: nucleotidyltransferase family protein [unclassified Ruminococcus]MCQ4021681.1 hypothetical protein [Ruminococcus sp. zg-924]MCQ4114126.1 hypothetical protein [Ruminococcus sp. zg-921]
MTEICYDMLYLSLCALNNITPSREYVEKINLDSLFTLCQSNSLSALVCYALEKVGISEQKWLQAKGKAIRKNLLLDAERSKITSFMNENGIKHMPLKGVYLKELYPKIGMRQMADNDIWYDKTFANEIKDFMIKLGYTVVSFGRGNHDCYNKAPVYNFEFHRTLFSKIKEPFYSYYVCLDKLLIKDDASENGYHLGIDDFYTYMIAHQYKHHSAAGTGLRSILDCCVYLKKFGEELNFKYIDSQTEKLKISDFELAQRQLCKKLNDMQLDILTESEESFIKCSILSGTYGKYEKLINNRVKEFGDNGEVSTKVKVKYVISRMFPPMEFYKEFYPFFYRHKFLIPICFLVRAYNGIFNKHKMLKNEINVVKKL